MDMRSCLECDTPLRGRSDQKFCCDHCRNMYNNRLHSKKSNYMRRVDRILRKNRLILEESHQKGNSRVPCSMLAKRGFNFHFFTHIDVEEDGTIIYCYDQGYQMVNEEELELKREQEESA